MTTGYFIAGAIVMLSGIIFGWVMSQASINSVLKREDEEK